MTLVSQSRAIPGRWLRHIKDGTIYGYSPAMRNNPMVEEVTEEQAFPENHIPEANVGRESVVDLSTDEDVIERAENESADLSAVAEEATRGLDTGVDV